jgi:hypothetical protein
MVCAMEAFTGENREAIYRAVNLRVTYPYPRQSGKSIWPCHSYREVWQVSVSEGGFLHMRHARPCSIWPPDMIFDGLSAI